MITVTYLAPRLVCRQTCSSTPMTCTPSRRCGSFDPDTFPPARTAWFAVFQITRVLCDPGDRQVLAYEAFERPPQTATRQSRAWRSPRSRVLLVGMGESVGLGAAFDDGALVDEAVDDGGVTRPDPPNST